MSDGFYITLPSNSSREFYGIQNPNNFKTKLSQPISLDTGQWSVGLAEVTYPLTWPNLDTFTIAVYVREASGAGKAYSKKMQGQRYLNAAHLVREIQWCVNKLLPETHANSIKVRYDDLSGRMRVVTDPDCHLWVSRSLAIILGYVTNTAAPRTEENETIYGLKLPREQTDALVPSDNREADESDFSVNINRLRPNIYIYCNVIEHQIIGDTKAPLLRILPVPETSTTGDVVQHKFTNIHYIPLSRGIFEVIELSIVDGSGDYIAFKAGYAILKLHFKRITP